MFTAAFSIGMFSFGGGVSGWTFRHFVTRNGWVTEGAFLADMAVARVLPGPNAANITALLGYRLLGLPGALAGLSGLLIGPFILLLAIHHLYVHYHSPALDASLQGAAAGAIGPLAYLVVRGTIHSGRTWYGAALLAGTAVAVLLNVPLPLAVLAALGLSLLLFWRFGGDDDASR
jgi:chromate transporter